MHLPFVIDNDEHLLADVLNRLLDETRDKPLDIATAYFTVSAYGIVKDRLHKVGAFRLLLGSEPTMAGDVGLRPDERKVLLARLRGDLEATAFTPEMLKTVEDLIAFLRADKVEVRLYDQGFLHAKAYLFHQDAVGPHNRNDRLLPYAAIVGSGNFTGPGLTTNRELNIVHRVFTADDAPTDHEAAERVRYLHPAGAEQETMLDPTGIEVPSSARRMIKSEVGARAITDLTRWFERQWSESVDFKEDLIELLDASKFGTKEYTPYQVYIKALYEYFLDELGEDAVDPGRSAVDLAEFQDDAVKKARRILTRYDGVLIADSVGLGKTWIGKKLLEDFAYHRRQKALVVCSASLREMWGRELRSATIAAEVVGMETMGRENFDPRRYGDADVILIDESHNFRNDKANRYLALEQVIQHNRGRGRDGGRKKVILLSATPMNNDLYDIANQVRLFTQAEPDYFRDAGIGDLDAYFRRARREVRQSNATAGTVLFNLLEEIIVRNTRPFIKAAYPNATIKGQPIRFPDRRLRTVKYSLGATYAGLYGEIVAAIESLSLAPYSLETYRKPETILDEQAHEWQQGREQGFVGIFRTRFLKRLESSVEAFRVSLHRALTFESTYLDYLLDGKVVASKDFQKAMRFLERDTEDDPSPGSVADALDDVEEARAYIESLPRVDLNQYDLRKLRHDVEADVALLEKLYEKSGPLIEQDAKLEALKRVLASNLVNQKVLIFSSFKDTARYVHRALTRTGNDKWRSSIGDPTIRRIDSGNHPDERGHILGRFAPVANEATIEPDEAIDVLVSTDVLSEGQNLQDCGVIINYDLTWNPIRLVQRNGRIDRIGSPHDEIAIYNMFPEDELERLLRLVERLTQRISQIDDLGFLDASVLGEVVHPRTFNTLRRIRDEDGSVLDEEEERAELAGPETLLKQLKEVLNREGSEMIVDLPHGIHSGLRRERAYGMFFYFQAPRADGTGKRHFWRYIDAKSHEIADNRFQIAQLIACQPDEPRYIGDQDVFVLQDRVIAHILQTEREVEAKAAAPKTIDPMQQAVTEELKNAIRRGEVAREKAKDGIRFLGQPMGRFAVKKLKTAWAAWRDERKDEDLLASVTTLARDFAKDPSREDAGEAALTRDDLELICFEYVSS
ncbi:MAG: helicase [Phycisphaerae bacterium]|nr:helicase [Phycisphaerae bacterium]